MPMFTARLAGITFTLSLAVCDTWQVSPANSPKRQAARQPSAGKFLGPRSTRTRHDMIAQVPMGEKCSGRLTGCRCDLPDQPGGCMSTITAIKIHCAMMSRLDTVLCCHNWTLPVVLTGTEQRGVCKKMSVAMQTLGFRPQNS